MNDAGRGLETGFARESDPSSAAVAQQWRPHSAGYHSRPPLPALSRRKPPLSMPCDTIGQAQSARPIKHFVSDLRRHVGTQAAEALVLLRPLLAKNQRLLKPFFCFCVADALLCC